MFACLHGGVQQCRTCKPESWKTLIKGVNREGNYMWWRPWAEALGACPTAKQQTNWGSQGSNEGKFNYLMQAVGITGKHVGTESKRKFVVWGLSAWVRRKDRGEMRLDHRDLLHGRGVLISIKTGLACSSRELKTLIVLSASLCLCHCWLYFIPLRFVSFHSSRRLLFCLSVHPCRLIVGDKRGVCNCLTDEKLRTQIVWKNKRMSGPFFWKRM